MKESQHQFICVVQIIFPPFISLHCYQPPFFRLIPTSVFITKPFYTHTHILMMTVTWLSLVAVCWWLKYFCVCTSKSIEEKFIHWQNDAQLYAFSFLCLVCHVYGIHKWVFFCFFCVLFYRRCRQKIIIVKHVHFFFWVNWKFVFMWGLSVCSYKIHFLCFYLYSLLRAVISE